MTILTVGDFLDWELGVQRELIGYYAEVRDGTRDGNVRLLAYHLRSDAARHAAVLGDVSADAIERVRGASCRFEATLSMAEIADGPSVSADQVGGAQLLDDALDRQGILSTCYRHILKDSKDEDVQRVLGALLALKDRCVALLKQMRAMDYFGE